MRAMFRVMLACGATAAVAAGDSRQAERDRMVDTQIAARGIEHLPTLAAMRKVPRHRFVPADVAPSAYIDSPLPIGHGQTISQPLIVAFMTEAAAITRDSRVLEIGTGSGYQAAVAAELSDHVYSIEIVPALAQRAKEALRETGYERIPVRAGRPYWSRFIPACFLSMAGRHPFLLQTGTVRADVKKSGRILPVIWILRYWLPVRTGG